MRRFVTVLLKRMLALVYEVTHLFVRAYEYGGVLLQEHLFAVLAFAKAVSTLSSTALAASRTVARPATALL
jgi:hypothetical protein